jgi:uncharacterized protein (UPF0248 family)/2'-5' RNA ligase
LESELCQLKDKYGDDCRIINSIGEFVHVVTVLLRKWNAKLKFQITADYPLVPAGFVVSGNDHLPGDLTSDLYQFLAAKNSNCAGSCRSMIETVQAAHCWLEENGIVTSGMIPCHTVDRRKKKKQGKVPTDVGVDRTASKKPPMKTAEDVIKRILWDRQLKPDDFVVGYMDRFQGVLEEDFTTFSWEDIASVDDHIALAIPKHRIQYFKYRGTVVWDKLSRLDKVFGSTGSRLTIMDVVQQLGSAAAVNGHCQMSRVKTVHVEDYTDDLKDVVEHSGWKESNDIMKCDEDENGEDSKEAVDSDDSDDDITVTIGCTSQSIIQCAPTMTSVEKQMAHSSQHRRPNYFVCQRITNPCIVQGIASVQDSIVYRDSRFTKCCIRPSSLHLTLCTLRLDTENQVMAACDALRQSSDKLSEMASHGIQFHVTGVDHFFQRVVYGCVRHTADFDEYVAHVRFVLMEAGIEIRDSYDFVPHVTVLKLSLSTGHDMSYKIPRWVYEDHQCHDFGVQNMTSIDLCAMTAERVDDFYVTPLHLDLVRANEQFLED